MERATKEEVDGLKRRADRGCVVRRLIHVTCLAVGSDPMGAGTRSGSYARAGVARELGSERVVLINPEACSLSTRL